MGFSEEILFWYRQNKRILPWRRTRDPYKIWISEIILQQTRVDQGMPYYLNFLDEFPTIAHLSDASETEVLKLWQGLGYYSRARNLHATARRIVREMNGEFPDTYEGLLSLKGVGDYTASAIASICFELPEPVVDGNVYRVLARYFGVDIPANSSEGKRYFKNLAGEIMDSNQPGEYNQAVMEFGALQCTPSNPDCTSCPLNSGCVALKNQKIHELPVKSKKAAPRKRFFNYLVPLDEAGQTVLKQREAEGIWQRLYEFPMYESERKLDKEEIREQIPARFLTRGVPGLYPVNEVEIVHKLSHQHLHTRFWILHMEGKLEDGIGLAELEKYPVPVLIADFIKTLKNSYF